MRRIAAAPFWTFTQRNGLFAHDAATGKTIRTSPAFYDLLSQRNLLAQGRAAEALVLVRDRYGDEVAQQVALEFNALCEQGFFRRWVTGPDVGDDRALVDRLVKARTNKIELYLTAGCNLSCVYCYAGKQGALKAQRKMPLSVAHAAIDLLFRRAGRTREVCVTFLGGEPLLNKSVLMWVVNYTAARARARGMRAQFSMTSNATLLDEEVISLIKRHNFGLMISLDGPPDVQNTSRPFRGGAPSFERAAANIRKLAQRRRQLTARCTLSRQNHDKLRVVGFLEEFGFTRIAPGASCGTAWCKGAADLTEDDHEDIERQEDVLMQDWLTRIETGSATPYNPYTESMRRTVDPPSHRIRCGVCRGVTTVDVDGRLYPCHRYVGMRAYAIGDAWAGVSDESHRHYLKGYLSSLRKCDACHIRRVCGGPCPWYVSRDDGTFVPPDTGHCRRVERWYRRMAALADEVSSRFPEYFRERVLDKRSTRGEDREPGVPETASETHVKNGVTPP
ncbi:MAG: radical SAM protein [Candidatus Sumerlaeia bacterium]|nr:radical SAM protein [Candidatus Sumerlaeia bacterium]